MKTVMKAIEFHRANKLLFLEWCYTQLPCDTEAGALSSSTMPPLSTPASDSVLVY